jgi:hypothetical protein
MGRFRVRVALVSALFLSGSALVGRDVTVVVDMTPEGRKAVHPTADRPAYYLTVMRGYQELGVIPAGEKPPTPQEIFSVVMPELAKQGYVGAEANHHAPDLVIDFAWGIIAPTDSSAPNALNEKQRYALVLGGTFADVVPVESFGHNEFMAAANDRRYFVVVTAYDYAAWAKQRRHLILWKAKMSVPSPGVYFDDVLVSLAKAAGPSFGRETDTHPRVVPADPGGRVDIGTATVRTDADPPPRASPK